MNYIHITNLKNIKELFFEIPNKPGSYLLTGTNGVGKTTLLICLARIKIVGIFNTNFRPNDNVKIDQFENSIIEFSVKGESVKYSYGGERWVPTQKGKTVLNDFGFPQVKYFQANASRIETVPKDLLNDKNIKKIDEKLIEYINEIFDTDKYSKLHALKPIKAKGPGITTFFIKINDDNYYSEKFFSLGERCVIKLLNDIFISKPKSLILIDEIEMALHPIIQKRLYRVLEKIAEKESHLILLSTHSSTLIKATNPSKIIHLEEYSKGKIKCISPCPPYVAIRTIDEIIMPELLLFVEDEKARVLLLAMIDYYLKNNRMDTILYFNDLIKVISIGGYEEVVQFLQNSSFIEEVSKRYAFLDKDVEDSIARITLGVRKKIRVGKEKYNAKTYDLFFNNKEKIFYLPITPERGILNFIYDKTSIIEKNLFKSKLNLKQKIDVYIKTKHGQDFISFMSKDYKKTKSENMKDLYKYIFEEISSQLNKKVEILENEVYGLFVEKHYEEFKHSNELKKDFGKIFGHL